MHAKMVTACRNFTILCLIVAACYSAESSSVAQHDICPGNRTVNDEGAAGALLHTGNSSIQFCSISVNKPTGAVHNYAVVEGVVEKTFGACPGYDLGISSNVFCISTSRFSVIDLKNKDSFTFILLGNPGSFILHYYFTGEMCDVLTLHSNP